MLNIFNAGVAMGIVRETIGKWNNLYPEKHAEMQAGGSVYGIKQLLAGEPFDLLILADDTIIKSLMADQTNGYIVFAGNKMVVCATEGKEINNDNWQEKLLEPKATFKHMNPYIDPNGYRAVMAMMLADHHEPGLTEKLLYHPGHIGMNPNISPKDLPAADYMFSYYSGAKNSNAVFAELPEVMDLSNDALADIYATAEFQVDEQNTVNGAPISHALTIPKTSPNASEACRFVDMFLENDFAAYNFIPKRKTVNFKS